MSVLYYKQLLRKSALHKHYFNIDKIGLCGDTYLWVLIKQSCSVNVICCYNGNAMGSDPRAGSLFESSLVMLQRGRDT